MGRTLQAAAFLFCAFTGGAFAQIFAGSIYVYAIQQIVPGNVQAGSGSMWQGVTAGTPQNWSYSDRMFVGNAAFNIPIDRNNTNTTFLPNATIGANWGPRDSQFVAMATAGNMAITGASRTSDGDAIGSGPTSSGLNGFVLCNSTLSRSCWAGYLDVQYESGGHGYGVEIALKNKASNVTTDPYSTPSTGGYGIQLAGGGDNSYGGASANPWDTGIIFTKNSNTFNQGIVFKNDALAGVNAISMGQTHRINWYSGASTISAQVMSGSGSPAGVVSCTARCLYLRTDGGAGTTLYVNETGGGTAGWAAK